MLLFKPIAFLFTVFVFQGLNLLSPLKAQTETLDACESSQIRVWHRFSVCRYGIFILFYYFFLKKGKFLLSSSPFWVIGSLLPSLVISRSERLSLLSFFQWCLSPWKKKSAYLNYMSLLKRWGFVVNISVCRNVSFSPSFFVVSVYTLKMWTVCLYKCSSLLEVACYLRDNTCSLSFQRAAPPPKKVRSPALWGLTIFFLLFFFILGQSEASHKKRRGQFIPAGADNLRPQAPPLKERLIQSDRG